MASHCGSFLEESSRTCLENLVEFVDRLAGLVGALYVGYTLQSAADVLISLGLKTTKFTAKLLRRSHRSAVVRIAPRNWDLMP